MIDTDSIDTDTVIANCKFADWAQNDMFMNIIDTDSQLIVNLQTDHKITCSWILLL